jgi:integrase
MGIWKDKERGDWIYTFQYKGETYGGRGFKTKARARTAREERRKEIKEEGRQKSFENDLESVSTKYLEHSERRHASKTYKQKFCVLTLFAAHLEKKGLKNPAIDKITPADLHSYLNTRPTNNNYNAHRKDLCALFTYARQVLKIPISHPCWDLERMPHTPAKTTPPSEKEILQLIMAADPEKDEKDFLLTILHTLARVDEILRLTWQDVNFEQRSIRLWTRKRKGGSYESNNLHMNEDLYQILKRRYKKRTHEKWVFPNPKTKTRYTRRPKFMRGLCKRAFGSEKEKKGKKPYTGPVYGFHSLRKAVATLLQDKEKVGTKTVSGILGHQSVRTTEIYLQVVPSDQVQALQKLEGRFDLERADEMVAGDGCGFEKIATTKRNPTDNTPREITK